MMCVSSDGPWINIEVRTDQFMKCYFFQLNRWLAPTTFGFIQPEFVREVH
jgi:hypothetical protein